MATAEPDLVYHHDFSDPARMGSAFAGAAAACYAGAIRREFQ
jgi:hypothetical protein